MNSEVDPVSHGELVQRIADQYETLTGADLVETWNGLFPLQEIEYDGDSLYFWVDQEAKGGYKYTIDEVVEAACAKLRPMEMAVCFSDGTWEAGEFVDIPADTAEGCLESKGIEVVTARYDEALKKLRAKRIEGLRDVVKVWLYNSMDDEQPE